ncbi:hypothetical protein MTBBW1_2030049 [Desulfamplus magnetovallimortis]|uniref:Glycosyltransferase 2-like domain-containing protein n=1 Tax=Desulfamplus magnetovallimortis TaxID=1246637 RepID=A0A1W1HBY7_9BACT|nr:glycosyltransferase family 2 protein [Desulfamplus magnetovallimortis]SLM29959.1 hypothetical protein MTBBW1_2030049 [Desulfamplus magnetovallimortis]
MSIAAIIVNYYTSALVNNLILDLFASSIITQIFIVDNSGDYSFDGPCSDFLVADQDIEREYHRVHVLSPGKNIGFGAGVNLAANLVDTEWILLLNPDMRVPLGAVEKLLSGAKSSGAVLAGPRFYWDDGKRFRLPPGLGASSWMDYALMSQSMCELDAQHLGFYWQIRHERFWSSAKPFAEPFLSGACMLINRNWAVTRHDDPEKKWIFDPAFFMYYEDADLSVSALKSGTLPVCIPDSEMIHYYNQSPAPNCNKNSLEPGMEKLSMIENSHGAFKKKHYPSMLFDLKSRGRYEPECSDLQEIDHYHPFEPDIIICEFDKKTEQSLYSPENIDVPFFLKSE